MWTEIMEALSEQQWQFLVEFVLVFLNRLGGSRGFFALKFVNFSAEINTDRNA